MSITYEETLEKWEKRKEIVDDLLEKINLDEDCYFCETTRDKKTILHDSACSFCPLESVHVLLVATEKFATICPPEVCRTSGSRVTLPITCAMLSEKAIFYVC